MTEVKEALTYISPDICRDDWAKVGMALKSEFGDSGFQMFDTWSQAGNKYDESACKSTWRSINCTGGVGIGTLFMMARDGGYKPSQNGAHKPFKAPLSASKPLPIDEAKDTTKSCEIAKKYWDESVPNLPHPYAAKKGFPDHGLRVHGDQLCVHAHNKNRQIQSIQGISHDGKKKNLASTKIKKCFHLIHGDASTIVICEGWATAKSVNAATKYVSVVSFGCAGLKNVAILMREKVPDSIIIIAADTGHVKEAQEAAMAVSGLVAVPQLNTGTDFNDLHVNESLESVTTQFQECIDRGYVSYGSDSDENENNWPEPEPLPVELRPVPALDINLLPKSLRGWIKDIALRQSSPIEFVVATALVMMSAVIGTRICIQPKRNDTNWLLQPNLWGAVVGNPSCMKSPAIKEARKPFKAVDAQFKLDSEEKLQPLRIEYKQRLLVWEAENKAIQSLYQQRARADMGGKPAKGVPDRGTLDKRNESLQLEKEELDALKVLAFNEPCMEISDATPEKLQVLQASNPKGVLMFRDEVAAWLEVISKPERAGERRYYLEGWAGDDSSVQHRISRETNEVQSNCISIFGSMQPGRLIKLVNDAQGFSSNADGLLQRFQVLVWSEDQGLPQVDAAPSLAAQQEAMEAFMRLYQLRPEDVGCIDHPRFPHLRFTSEAAAAFLDWINQIQARARRLDPALQSHLVKYRSLAPSIALLFHLIDGGHGDVPLSVLNRAIGICDWLWQHALRVYSSGHYSKQSSLVRLCRHILDGDLGESFSLYELHRKGWSGITKETTKALLTELEGMNWLRHTKVHGERGGPISHLYRINPRLNENPDFHIGTAITDTTTSNIPPPDSYRSYSSTPEKKNKHENMERTNETSDTDHKEFF